MALGPPSHLPPAGRPPGVDPNLSGSAADRIAREVATAQRDPERQFGRYLILSELGKGGMGVVWRAWDPGLSRLVAVKVIREIQGDAEQLRKRFEREAKAAARLRHPSIVAVHEFGRHDGQMYLVMDFVEGELLGEWLETPRQPLEVAKVIRDLARALAVAHDAGVVHRDVKPDNVLIDATTGIPRLMDFGLARDLTSAEVLTMPGQLLGTPAYMAPEQARGDTDEVGTQTDIYALGALLYHALVGEPPFRAKSVPKLLKMVRNETPVPPRERRPEIPEALEAVALRCLEKKKADRFETSSAMADALDEVLGEPELDADAARARRTERAARAARRQPSRAARAAGAGAAAGGSRRIWAIVAAIATVGGIAAGVVAAITLASGASAARAVHLSAPEDGEVTNATAVGVRGRVTEGHPEAIWIGAERVAVAEDGTFEGAVELPPGSHVVEVRAKAGGPKLASALVHVDRTPPTAVVRSPAEGAVVDTRSPVVRGIIRDEFPARVRSADGSSSVPVGPDGTFAITATLPDGEDRLHLVAEDRAGNQTPIEVGVDVDTDPPKIIVAGLDGLGDRPWLPSVLYIRGHVVDAHPASTIEVAGLEVVLRASNTFAVRVNLKEGLNEVVLETTDAAGHTGRVDLSLTQNPLGDPRVAQLHSGRLQPTTWWNPTPEQIEAAANLRSNVWFNTPPTIGVQFVVVPPGKLTMGSPETEPGRAEGETAHEVTITKPFWITAAEITNEQFQRFKPDHDSTGGDETLKGRVDAPKHPVGHVTWEEAAAYCRWLDEKSGGRWKHRLPTEAEWEWAARAGSQTSYPWGDDPAGALHFANVNDPATKALHEGSHAEFPSDDGFTDIAPVQSLLANRFGLFDMIGNVAEWVADWEGPYPSGPVIDPKGAPTGTSRVWRGGTWYHPPAWCRSAYRRASAPEARNHAIGFRVVTQPASIAGP